MSILQFIRGTSALANARANIAEPVVNTDNNELSINGGSIGGAYQAVADEAAMLALTNQRQGDTVETLDNNRVHQMVVRGTGTTTAIGDWQIVGASVASGTDDATTEVSTSLDIFAVPYKQGDVRTLTISEGGSTAGSYKANQDETVTGSLAHFTQISIDDYGVLAP